MSEPLERTRNKSPQGGAAPGPHGLAILRYLLPGRRYPLRLLPELTARYGDVVCVNRRLRIFLISHPDHLDRVLRENHEAYVHNVRSRLFMGAGSLALAEGDAWRQKRRLMQPLFQRQRLAERFERLPRLLDPRLERWSRAADAGETVDLAREMTDLTLDVLVDLLLGLAPGDPGHGELVAPVREAFEYFNDRQAGRLPLLSFLARRRRRELAASVARMEAQVKAHVDRRREAGDGGSDLLAGFLAARDSRNETAMTERQVLDEVTMLLVMGHMTTAMALTWSLHLLATHPEAEARVVAELAEVLGERAPRPDDLPRLERTVRAIQEALRLYPSTWRFARRAVADDEVGGHPIPAGSTVVVSPWVTHRRADLWPEPNRFDPERFLPERVRTRHRLAYLPFGAGPRACIAGELAMMEMPLVVASIFQRFRLAPAAERPALAPAITLQPAGGLPVSPSPRVPGEGAPRTLADLALAAFAPGRSDALLERRNGGWRPVAAGELRERTARRVAALDRLGLAPGDPVAFLCAGSADSLSLEAACWLAGLAVAPLHPGLLAAEAIDLCRTARARALFVDGSGGDERVSALAAGRSDLPDLRHLVLLSGDGAAPTGVDARLTDLLAGGAPADLEARARERRPEEPAYLALDASGPGAPRSVPISHGAQLAAVRALGGALPAGPGPAVSFLPPSEPLQRAFAALCLLRRTPLALAGPLGTGQDPSGDLARLRPRVLAAPPELFTWFMNRVYGWAHGGGGVRRRLFRWAVATGRRSAPRRMAGGTPGGLALAAADRLVFARLRELLGGRLEAALCAGPLTSGWTGFLWALGVPAFPSYGLAAASPLAASRAGRVRPGTVGVPLPGIEVRIALDGEVLARGEAVAGSRAPGGDGWLATGDAGRLDPDGFLEVYGPKTHALRGPGGAPVHPAPLETALRAGHFFSQALVVAADDGRLGALLAPDLDALGAWAAKRGLDSAGDAPALLGHDAVRALLETDVRSINGLVDEARRVTAWRILPDGFSRAAGEVAPDGRLRREVVLERRGDELAALWRPRS